MTKFSNAGLMTILEKKSNLFDLVEEKLTDMCNCAYGEAIFRDSNADKYYRFNYKKILEGEEEYYLGKYDGVSSIEEVKRIVEVLETLRDGKVVSRRESIRFEEIGKEDLASNPA